MPSNTVDVASLGFWLIVAIALVVVTPLRGRFRHWVLAAINLLFLGTLLDPRLVLAAAAGLILVWLLVTLLAKGPSQAAGLLLAALTLVLFIINKFPAVTALLPDRTLPRVLTVVGFSYVALRIVDMLRGVWEARSPAPGIADTINYLIPFHMLAAGPIQSYEEFRAAATPVPLTANQALWSLERVAEGLFKKFVLAAVVDKVFLTGFQTSGWQLFLEMQFFYVWLYLDFSALSDLAVGLGGLLGVATPENFNRPYLARNMIVFWERWHISLSLFIRRNLFTPVQLWLVRRFPEWHPLGPATAAFTIAFALCGLWHAGTWPFLAWGLLHALGLVVTNLYRHVLTRRLGARGVKRYLENRPIRIMSTVLTFEFVAFSLMIIGIPW